MLSANAAHFLDSSYSSHQSWRCRCKHHSPFSQLSQGCTSDKLLQLSKIVSWCGCRHTQSHRNSTWKAIECLATVRSDTLNSFDEVHIDVIVVVVALDDVSNIGTWSVHRNGSFFANVPCMRGQCATNIAIMHTPHWELGQQRTHCEKSPSSGLCHNFRESAQSRPSHIHHHAPVPQSSIVRAPHQYRDPWEFHQHVQL